MAFVHGVVEVFKLDDSAGTLRDLSTYLTNIDHPREQSSPESTTFQVAGRARTFIVGLNGATISISGLYDSTATTGPDVVLSGNIGKLTTSTYEYGPEGSTTGLVKYTGECILNNYSISGPVDGIVTFAADLQITGVVTRTTF